MGDGMRSRQLPGSGIAAVALLSLLGAAPAWAVCAGDCSGDGEVTVNELVLGVNIALGNAAIEECGSFDVNSDAEVTVTELIGAVNSALNGCTGFAGHYRSTVTLDGGRTGTMDLTVQPNGTATGELVISDGGTAAAGSGSAGAVVANVSLSGSVNLDTGEFSITGSYLDAHGQTVPINVAGTLPFQIGGAGTVNFQIGPNGFTGSIVAAAAGTPTPTPTGTPIPGTTHVVKVGQVNLPFDPELLVIKVGDTVTWMWVGGTHSVRSGPNFFPPTCEADGLFDSGAQSSGTFSYTFTTPGNYGYHCGVAGHCANFESGEIQVMGTPTPTLTVTPRPTATPTPTVEPTATLTPSTIGGVSTGMLGVFVGRARNQQFGNEFAARFQISADANGVSVTDLPTTDGNVIGGVTLKMTVDSPTHLSFSDPNPFHMIAFTLELVGPGHVTGTYAGGSQGMGSFTITLDLTRVP